METHSEIYTSDIGCIENSTWLTSEGISPLYKAHPECNYLIDTTSFKPVISPVQIKRIEQLLFKYTRLAEKFPHEYLREVKFSRTPQSQFRRRQSLKISQDLLHIADVAKTPTRLRLLDTPKSIDSRKSYNGGIHQSQSTPAVKLFETSPDRIVPAKNRHDTADLFSLLISSLENQHSLMDKNLLDTDVFCNDTTIQLQGIDNNDILVFDFISGNSRIFESRKGATDENIHQNKLVKSHRKEDKDILKSYASDLLPEMVRIPI